MKSFCRAALVSAVVTILSTLMPQAVASPPVTVDSVELVDSTRIDRTTFEYTYRISATNNGPVALEDVTAYLSTSTSPPPSVDDYCVQPDPVGPVDSGNANGTLLLDCVISLGTISAGATVISTDTIKLQQDRNFLLDPDELFWEVGFNAIVTLTGVVTDQPISFAGVSVEVYYGESGRPIIESGRPIIEIFNTTADEDGNFSIDVPFVTDRDFVEITGVGVNELDFVQLRSIVGSAGSLLEEATVLAGRSERGSKPSGPSRGVLALQVDSSDFNALKITHVSTALAVLATEANDGQGFTNDTDLAAAQALVDNEELLISAAVIKTVIDNTDIDLPPGVANTEELLENPTVFDELLEDLETNNPEELQDAIDQTIEDLAVDYVASEVPPVLYLSLVRVNPLRSDANVFTFDQNSTATHIDGIGETTDADWTVNAEGHLVVDLNNPPVNEFFNTLEVPPDSGNFEQVRVNVVITQLRIVRIAVGIESDQVLLGGTQLRTYPDHEGVLPDEIIDRPADAEFAYLGFDTSGILPYSSVGLAGTTVGLTHYHRDNNSLNGGFDQNSGSDLLTFNANGSGTTARKQFDFTWALDPQGRLTVTFINGDSSEYIRYGQIDAGQVDLGIIVGRVLGSSAKAVDSLSVYPTDGTTFNVGTLLNHKFRSAFFVLEPASPSSSGLPRFDFNFLDSGVGCQDFGGIAEFDWLVNPQGYMELQRSSQQRAWQAIAMVPGQLGPRYWVLENLDFDNPPDPTQTPGRVNFYEDLGDISGNTPPVAVADSINVPNPLPTTAASEKFEIGAGVVQDQTSNSQSSIAYVAGAPEPVFVDVLANDTDAQNDPIMFYTFSGTDLGGTVDFSYGLNGFPDGLLYTPPLEVSDSVDTFTYSIVDGSCGYAIEDGVVTVTIGAP